MPGREKGGLTKGLYGEEEIEEGASQRIATGEQRSGRLCKFLEGQRWVIINGDKEGE